MHFQPALFIPLLAALVQAGTFKLRVDKAGLIKEGCFVDVTAVHGCTGASELLNGGTGKDCGGE